MPSPASSSRPIAKKQMRVRLSVLKAGLAVGENGSALNVTDSSAIARVLAAWLSKTGFLFVAAAAGLKQTKRTKKKANILGARLAVRITKGSVTIVGKCSLIK